MYILTILLNGFSHMHFTLSIAIKSKEEVLHLSELQGSRSCNVAVAVMVKIVVVIIVMLANVASP